MQRVVLTVAKNLPLTPLIYEMQLVGDVSGITRAGQFVEIALDGLYLRRPISVCDYEEGRLTLVYKVVGKGTDLMSQMAEGTELDVLTGLGNGFDVDYECQKPLLVGGGVGVPPLYRLTRDLIARGKEVAGKTQSVTLRRFTVCKSPIQLLICLREFVTQLQRNMIR